jgi:hypothetical protein
MPLVEDTVFDPNHQQYEKHTFAHTLLILTQVTVLYQKSAAISIENPRVGGSIPPPGITFKNNINDLNFAH